MVGTHDDALLIVELSKWGALIGLPEAGRTVFADGFDRDSAEATNPSVWAVLGFYETIATLVKNNLLSSELVFDWLWVSGAWDRVGPAAIRAREKSGASILYENFEALAARQRSWPGLAQATS
jgi:hypothetical protein